MKKIDFTRNYAQHFGGKARYSQDGLDFDAAGNEIEDKGEAPSVESSPVLASLEGADWRIIKKVYEERIGGWNKLPKLNRMALAKKALEKLK